jgi:hypothetical protein
MVGDDTFKEDFMLSLIPNDCIYIEFILKYNQKKILARFFKLEILCGTAYKMKVL